MCPSTHPWIALQFCPPSPQTPPMQLTKEPQTAESLTEAELSKHFLTGIPLIFTVLNCRVHCNVHKCHRVYHADTSIESVCLREEQHANTWIRTEVEASHLVSFARGYEHVLSLLPRHVRTEEQADCLGQLGSSTCKLLSCFHF